MLLLLLIPLVLFNCTAVAVLLLLALDKPADDRGRKPLLWFAALCAANALAFLTLYSLYANGLLN